MVKQLNTSECSMARYHNVSRTEPFDYSLDCGGIFFKVSVGNITKIPASILLTMQPGKRIEKS